MWCLSSKAKGPEQESLLPYFQSSIKYARNSYTVTIKHPIKMFYDANEAIVYWVP